jgi:hypothetical protein
MKRNWFVAVLVTACMAMTAEAAIFTSTSLGGLSAGQIGFSGFAGYPGQNIVPAFRSYAGAVDPSVVSIDVSVDTTADTGRVVDIDFGPTQVPAMTLGGNFNVDLAILETPANFPDPPVYHYIQGTYGESVSIDAVQIGTPQFISSTTAAIGYSGSGTTFHFRPQVALSLPTFTVTGTYHANGPTESVNVPFSVQFGPTVASEFVNIPLAGGSGFGDGFDFAAYYLDVSYTPVNGGFLFNGTVDEINMQGSLTGVTLRYFVPEPTSLGMGLLAIVAAAAARRSQVGRRNG